VHITLRLNTLMQWITIVVVIITYYYFLLILHNKNYVIHFSISMFTVECNVYKCRMKNVDELK